MASAATDSMAKVVAAMSAMRWATASCLPTGRPHCTRSAAHSRAMFSATLALPTQMLGMERRPSLSVVSAIFRPLPSPPTRFSAGTRTFVKRIWALLIAFRPMNRQRCSTTTPGQAVSTMKALVRLVPGATAITTSRSASVPFVHQSLVPLSR